MNRSLQLSNPCFSLTIYKTVLSYCHQVLQHTTGTLLGTTTYSNKDNQTLHFCQLCLTRPKHGSGNFCILNRVTQPQHGLLHTTYMEDFFLMHSIPTLTSFVKKFCMILALQTGHTGVWPNRVLLFHTL